MAAVDKKYAAEKVLFRRFFGKPRLENSVFYTKGTTQFHEKIALMKVRDYAGGMVLKPQNMY